MSAKPVGMCWTVSYGTRWGKYVHYVPVCPEVECSFGIPRETFQLVGDKQPRLVTSHTGTGVDHTDRMDASARKRLADLEIEDICGFIFKSASPAGGIDRVKVCGDKGVPRKIEVGICREIR